MERNETLQRLFAHANPVLQTDNMVYQITEHDSIILLNNGYKVELISEEGQVLIHVDRADENLGWFDMNGNDVKPISGTQHGRSSTYAGQNLAQKELERISSTVDEAFAELGAYAQTLPPVLDNSIPELNDTDVRLPNEILGL